MAFMEPVSNKSCGPARRRPAVHPSDHQRQADGRSRLHATDEPLDLSHLSVTQFSQSGVATVDRVDPS